MARGPDGARARWCGTNDARSRATTTTTTTTNTTMRSDLRGARPLPKEDREAGRPACRYGGGTLWQAALFLVRFLPPVCLPFRRSGWLGRRAGGRVGHCRR